MSNEMLHKTAENALTVIVPYEEYLIDRARGLTGENSQTPPSLGDIAIRLLVVGALAPSPHMMDFSQGTIPSGGDSIQMIGEGAARRAEFALEVADFYGTPQQRMKAEVANKNIDINNKT